MTRIWRTCCRFVSRVEARPRRNACEVEHQTVCVPTENKIDPASNSALNMRNWKFCAFAANAWLCEWSRRMECPRGLREHCITFPARDMMHCATTIPQRTNPWCHTWPSHPALALIETETHHAHDSHPRVGRARLGRLEGLAAADDRLHLTPPLYRDQARDIRQIHPMDELTTTPQPVSSPVTSAARSRRSITDGSSLRRVAALSVAPEAAEAHPFASGPTEQIAIARRSRRVQSFGFNAPP